MRVSFCALPESPRQFERRGRQAPEIGRDVLIPVSGVWMRWMGFVDATSQASLNFFIGFDVCLFSLCACAGRSAAPGRTLCTLAAMATLPPCRLVSRLPISAPRSPSPYSSLASPLSLALPFGGAREHFVL